MTKKTKLQKIKLFFKASIVFGVLLVFVVCGILFHPTHTFENANLRKWQDLTQEQRVSTLQRIIPNVSDQELLLQCVNKIAGLPNSNEMLIKDATVICHSGIQMNASTDEE